MKRVLTALLSAAVLFGAAVPANAAPAVPGVCDEAAMNKIVDLGYVWPTPWDRCQFKLFIPNPNRQNLTWNENEWFQGNNFFSVQVTPPVTNSPPPTSPPQDILDYYAQIEEHLYWGRLSKPASPLTQETLSRGAIRFYSGADYEGAIWARGTYFNFPPKKPGVYKWRYTWVRHICLEDGKPCSGDVTGHITIKPAPVIGPAS